MKMNKNLSELNLEEIESELQDLVSHDKKHWINMFLLMNEVQQRNLFKPKFSSFTQWVNDFATKSKVHVSLLWSRLKAGKTYQKYVERSKDKGQEVKPIEEMKISADSLNLIDKIAAKNNLIADDLIEKVERNELTRADLKNAWSKVRDERIKKGIESTQKNHHDADKYLDEKISTKISAAEIVLALSQNAWLRNSSLNTRLGSDRSKDQVNHFSNKYIQEKYKTFTEFAVQTGSSQHARRIDVLVIENISLEDREKKYSVHLHGIEIKVDVHDLINDHKMLEYTDFVDFFWLAIPNNSEMLQAAEDVMNDHWGLLLIDDQGEVNIHQMPTKLQPILREETLMAALIKTL